MKSLSIALGLLLVLVCRAVATVIEVPLPELVGTYTCAAYPYSNGCDRTVAIHLPVNPAVIHSVSLRVNGTMIPTIFTCDIYPPAPHGVLLTAELYEPGNTHDYCWVYRPVTQEGPMVYFETLQPYPANMTWAFLLDGAAELHFRVDGSSVIPECGPTGPYQPTTVESAALLVDGDFPTPVARHSWGHLKSIYR
jgi:hypothetical protein